MLTYKDSLRQRLYSDSFEEGLRFGIKYFAAAAKIVRKLKASDLPAYFHDAKNSGIKIGNTGQDYWTLKKYGISDEQILSQMNGITDSGAISWKKNKSKKGAFNMADVEGYGKGEVEYKGNKYHGVQGYGGNYENYSKAATAANQTALTKEQFNRILKERHEAESEWANQFFGGSGSGRGGSGSGSGKEEGGVWNWIKENPGKTAAIGGGALVTGLGARALLKGRDDRDDRYYR